MRVLRTAALAAATLLIAAPAVAQAPVTELQPDRLPRGEDVAIPHVEDRTFVDGDRRVVVDAPRVVLLGRSGSSFILGTTGRNGTRDKRILRLRPDDSVKVLLEGVSPWEVHVSQDGRHLVHARARDDRRTRVRVWKARNARLVKDRFFRSYLDVMDADAGVVLFGSWDRGTLAWRLGGGVERLSRRPGSVGDLRLDLFSSYTGDPYQGGCTKVARLSDPRRILWSSCEERVHVFSPDGRRMATIDLLSDGIGPREVWQRTVRGNLLARYRTNWFGTVEWESPTALLLETNGDEASAVVRCVLRACENATDPGPVPQLRAG